jgi:hypothetical protein
MEWVPRLTAVLGVVAAVGGCVVHIVPDDRMCAACTLGDEAQHARARRLRDHVETLALCIGERSYRVPQSLDAAADWIEKRLDAIRVRLPDGRATVTPRPYKIDPDQMRAIKLRARCRVCPQDPELRSLVGPTFRNVELAIAGERPGAGSVVVGAHYDSDSFESRGCNPGADDNASGVAAMVELAEMIADDVAKQPLDRNVLFVAFTNEEEPFFQTDAMGSRVYARRQRPDDVVAMLSLETLGYYSDERGSQAVPPLVDGPDTGNFVAFVANRRSSELLEQALSAFRDSGGFRAIGIRAWEQVPGITWSDHWSFWREKIPALMVTDTALNRNLCYHRACDTPDRLDYARMALVVAGLKRVVVELATVAGR